MVKVTARLPKIYHTRVRFFFLFTEFPSSSSSSIPSSPLSSLHLSSSAHPNQNTIHKQKMISFNPSYESQINKNMQQIWYLVKNVASIIAVVATKLMGLCQNWPGCFGVTSATDLKLSSLVSGFRFWFVFNACFVYFCGFFVLISYIYYVTLIKKMHVIVVLNLKIWVWLKRSDFCSFVVEG